MCGGGGANLNVLLSDLAGPNRNLMAFGTTHKAQIILASVPGVNSGGQRTAPGFGYTGQTHNIKFPLSFCIHTTTLYLHLTNNTQKHHKPEENKIMLDFC